MINQDKWISSLPKTNINFDEKMIQVDHHRWKNTISKNNTSNTVKKYSLMAILFVSGLLFVSAVKNETRNLEKKINNLTASKNVIKFNLDQAILDNEVITSPENITRLAKEYLNTDFISYKKSQIKHLDEHAESFAKNEYTEIFTKSEKKNKNLGDSIKLGIVKKIEKKKTEIRKLQELYTNPESIPDEIKTQVAMKIEKKKIELKNIYSEPKDILTLERVGRWSIIQVVKLFLGMPVIPGK